jgi:hypothetical protein
MPISKDQSIIMQVAAKIAADLTPKGNDVNANIVAFNEAYDMVCDIILTSQGMTMTGATAPTPAPSTMQQAQDEQTLMQAFPEATPMATQPATAGGGFTVRIKGKQHGPIPQWLNDQCAVKGVTEVWDNRDGLQANPKRPWFKSTNTNDAFWAPK